jgi:hypothetical protein
MQRLNGLDCERSSRFLRIGEESVCQWVCVVRAHKEFGMDDVQGAQPCTAITDEDSNSALEDRQLWLGATRVANNNRSSREFTWILTAHAPRHSVGARTLFNQSTVHEPCTHHPGTCSCYPATTIIIIIITPFRVRGVVLAFPTCRGKYFWNV